MRQCTFNPQQKDLNLQLLGTAVWYGCVSPEQVSTDTTNYITYGTRWRQFICDYGCNNDVDISWYSPSNSKRAVSLQNVGMCPAPRMFSEVYTAVQDVHHCHGDDRFRQPPAAVRPQIPHSTVGRLAYLGRIFSRLQKVRDVGILSTVIRPSIFAKS